MSDLSRSDVFVDVCVQRDYLAPDGVRRCKNAHQAIPNIRRLMAFARWAKLPVLSCVDVRRPNQIDHEMRALAPNGDPERAKAPYTLLPDHAVVESDNCLCVPLDVLCAHQQTIFTKYHRDPFTNPKLDRLLTETPVGRFVVFGVPLESTVRILVLGLVRRHRVVVVVTDACGFYSPEEAAMTLRQLSVKGCELVTADAFVSAEFGRRRRPFGSRRTRSVA